MNQQKTKKAGILKYSLIVPLALALVLSSNAETLVSSATKLISSDKNVISSENKVTSSENKALASNDTIKNKTSVQPDSQMPDVKSSFKVTQVEKTNGDTLHATLATTVIDVDSMKEKSYKQAEKMPRFPEGENALLHFIATNLRYPIKAQENGIQGKVIVRFIVASNGKVEDAVVVKSIKENTKKLNEVVVVGYGAKKGTDDKGNEQKQIQPGTDMKLLEQEAIRIINTLPGFIPGEIKGQKVAVYYTLPITFKLE